MDQIICLPEEGFPLTLQSQSPKCTSCVDDATECTYVTREGEDRRAALIRRRTELEEERDQLNSLFRSIQTCPEAVALDVFRCLRENPDESTAALARNIEAVIQRHAESQSQPSQRMDGIQEAESSIQKK